MGARKNYVGEKFGRLSVVRYVAQTKWKAQLYECKCECGNKKIISIRALLPGHTKSCGCLQSEHAKRHVYKIAEEKRKNKTVKTALFCKKEGYFQFEEDYNLDLSNFIYEVKNLVNGKIYIGKTSRTLKKLLYRYYRDRKILNRPITSAIQKYGVGNFIFNIIDFASTEEELNAKEIFWIDLLNSRNKLIGYNLALGGAGVCGIKLTEKQKRTIGERFKGHTFNLGRKHTEAAKLRMRQSKAGKYIGENSPFYGQKHTLETRNKISLIQTGKTWEERLGNDRAKTLKEESRIRFSGENNPLFRLIKKEDIEPLIIQGVKGKEISRILKISEPTLARKIKLLWGLKISQVRRLYCKEIRPKTYNKQKI